MPHLLLNIDWSFLDHYYMGETTANFLRFAGIALATLLLKNPLAALLTRLSSGLAARYSYMQHKTAIREMLFKPIERLLQTVLYFIAVNQLDHLLAKIAIRHTIGGKEKINLKLDDITDHIFLFLFIVFLTQVFTRFTDFVYYLRMGKAEAEQNLERQQLLPLIKEISKLTIWILSAFWILGSVFHVNIPALITGLGIGGVAIALAGKETVENFFAAFTILTDKPFQTGDTIKLGEVEGVVERIGFRSTRLRNADGSAYIVPNQNLVSQSVVNMSMRDNRLIKIVANLKYGVASGTLQQLTDKIKTTLLAHPPVIAPVEVIIETFDKETFQMVISYHLPHPLPEGLKLNAVKREINLLVYDIITTTATIGTPVGTS